MENIISITILILIMIINIYVTYHYFKNSLGNGKDFQVFLFSPMVLIFGYVFLLNGLLELSNQ